MSPWMDPESPTLPRHLLATLLQSMPDASPDSPGYWPNDVRRRRVRDLLLATLEIAEPELAHLLRAYRAADQAHRFNWTEEDAEEAEAACHQLAEEAQRLAAALSDAIPEGVRA